MPVVEFASIKTAFQEYDLDWWMAHFPKPLQEKLQRYHFLIDQQRGALGKILLWARMIDWELVPKFQLSDLQLSPEGRPSLDTTMDFNISHSGDVAICAACTHGQVGVDVEEIRDISLSDFRAQFHPEEWESIASANSSLHQFYYLWTRKEAVVKASGVGIRQLASISVLADQVESEGQCYFLHSSQLDSAHQMAIATTKEQKEIPIQSANLNALISFLQKKHKTKS